MLALYLVYVLSLNYLFIYVVLDYEADYLSIVEETEQVAEWFTLGVYLKLPHSELEMIRADFPLSCKEAKREMLYAWLKQGCATWSSLIRALSKIGFRSLGKKIATRQG